MCSGIYRRQTWIDFTQLLDNAEEERKAEGSADTTAATKSGTDTTVQEQ
jgi:hypothetical protein